MRSSQRKQTHLRYCCQYSRDTIIRRILVLQRFHICKYGSYPFLIVDRSRPYRPTHVKLLPTVTAILRNSRTKPRQISYTVVLDDERGEEKDKTEYCQNFELIIETKIIGHITCLIYIINEPLGLFIKTNALVVYKDLH